VIEAVRQILWALLSKLHYYFGGSYTHKVLASAWDLFAQLWYFLVLGVVFTAFISVFWRKSDIAAFLQRSPRRSILTATLVGVVSPVPTYVAIPLVAALYTVGVPVAPLFAFLVASPLMNPLLFSLTAGAFGYEMAVARAVSAVALGIAAGVATQFLVSRHYLGRLLSEGSTAGKALRWDDSRPHSARVYVTEFFHHLYRNSRFISKYFFLGIITAAVVKELIPATWIITTLGNQRTFSVLVAVAAGVPLYACGGGSIPVMQTLQQLGMDKGAVLAFFISGPATKLSTLVALKAAIRTQAFMVYLAIGLLGASVFGYLYSIW
jgi:uncharacterized membrane protein YraQ (UPF0718 family)